MAAKYSTRNTQAPRVRSNGTPQNHIQFMSGYQPPSAEAARRAAILRAIIDMRKEALRSLSGPISLAFKRCQEGLEIESDFLKLHATDAVRLQEHYIGFNADLRADGVIEDCISDYRETLQEFLDSMSKHIQLWDVVNGPNQRTGRDGFVNYFDTRYLESLLDDNLKPKVRLNKIGKLRRTGRAELRGHIQDLVDLLGED